MCVAAIWCPLFFFNMQIATTFFTLDPGARSNGGTGLSFFRSSKLAEFTQFCSTANSYDDRCTDLVLFSKSWLSIFSQSFTENIPIYIERPKFFKSFKGQTAAESDSLIKLAKTYGRFWQMACDIQNIFPVDLEIVKWKGQLHNDKLKPRIEKMTGLTFSKTQDDVMCAIGMGLHLIGKL